MYPIYSQTKEILYGIVSVNWVHMLWLKCLSFKDQIKKEREGVGSSIKIVYCIVVKGLTLSIILKTR